MAASANPPRQHPVQGAAAILLAESLALPAGLITAAFLTRWLGPEGYGRYSVAAILITTVEWVLVAALSRPIVRLIADAGDWQPVGAAAFRMYTGAGVLSAATIWLLATPVAALLRDPPLAAHLRLFAAELPFFAAAAACRGILTGLASFRQRAVAGAGRWVARVALIVLFVELGLAVDGAILGSIGGAIVAWLVGQAFVGRSIWSRTDFPLRRLSRLAVPVFLMLMSARLFDRFALLALEAFGGTASEAGFYGAAQNVFMGVGIVSMSISPILISTLTAARRAGEHGHARDVAMGSLRLVLALLPFAGIVAGASPEVVDLLFGSAFLQAAPLVGLLVFAAVASILTSVAVALAIASERTWPLLLLTAPLLPLSLLGHAFMVPRFAALGAAIVTTATAILCAVVSVLAVRESLAAQTPHRHPEPKSGAHRGRVCRGFSLACARCARPRQERDPQCRNRAGLRTVRRIFEKGPDNAGRTARRPCRPETGERLVVQPAQSTECGAIIDPSPLAIDAPGP